MNKRFIWAIAIFAILYFFIFIIASFFIDYEWFKINDGLNIFWILFFTKFNVHTLFGLLFVVIFFLNFLLIRLLGGKGRIFTKNILNRLQIPILGSPKRALFIILAIGVIIIGFIMGGAAASYWKEYLMFKNSIPFDAKLFPPDPIFNLNIGFYIFSLPFYKFLYNWLMSSLLIIAIFSIFFHILNGGILWGNNRLEFSLFSRAHISTLLASIVFLHGISYRLSAYELLFSSKGKFFGAGYTAINANLIAYNVAMVISFIASALLLFNIFKRSFKLPLIVLATLIPAYFIMGVIFPSIQQRFIVVPNELDKEKLFIQNNIKYTRIAYDIERVKEKNFANKQNLTYKDIVKNKVTLENIRLWDWRPLKQTYKQLQELKPYYFFNDVDVDRYTIDNKKIAVNLSARELSINHLGKNSQTWQNMHLIYTHGYGVVMSKVDKITNEGLPVMLIKDIPPQSDINLKIERPEIYYGEHNNSYVITNTSIQPGEFDYPFGDVNKYTTYKGTGGTKLDSFFKRLLFASIYKDINILISGNIKNESRLLYRRNINEMINNFTPFLEFDDDPYLVISNGKLYWIIDAYTTTNQFPYSTPSNFSSDKKINYIRNSVKITIDAYNGKMDYYISDNNDPLIKVYAKIFPGIFKDISKMSDDLKMHIRYPETIFNIQSQMLLRYHMTNPNVFYNNEDLWDIPNQVFENKTIPVHSYYFITSLPNESSSGFILILPFTPYKKNNMIAFLVAKCDTSNYGELTLYMLPKDKLSYGPLQIEAKINQDPEISKQLSLWNQKGTGVIRGNMLAIPIEESILYIEPLYLKAESSEMPELKRVIVSFADRIAMEVDLATALEKLFYKSVFLEDDFKSRESYEIRIKDMTNKAYTHFNSAEQHMKNGNWAKYGEELEKLKEILIHMKNMK